MKIDTIENRMCLGDSDNDGWCDDIDPYPYTPGVNCPESDIDHDGIPDDEDDCPNDPGTSYYNGCPAPGEEDTDGDGVPDTYDHCPNQAGPASNNGCPLPEDCLCKDREDVKELLDLLGYYNDAIDQTNISISKWEAEYDQKYEEAKKKKEELDKEINPKKWDWIGFVGGGFWAYIKRKAEDSAWSLIGGAIGGFIFTKSLRLIYESAFEGYPILYRMSELVNLIDHNKENIQWYEERIIVVTNDIRNKCPCAIN
ncbi:hypothetical protein DRN58_07350 [Thermococci archaeon]|nr:MAG: hypothetical protein DRN58_07350 [Thermococci archaeon]